ncbi:hypothetical protein EWM64_g1064 [Hericium alpestre]|uniref:Tetrapyrrole biosynthesis uroporphyrinogen III synthase domain-containing protein n=1 Tax=Hericium alpestre TaxID=135208 RepID=A0A4Z0A9E4_9AGAM|nr:hypothetical protein EWM64_g1064 [Hericium alpestre]
MAHVLLLRAPSSASATEPDRYEGALSNAGFHPISVPVLQTVLVNIGDLSNIVNAGPITGGFDGVIVTSARAAASKTDWRDTPFYTVGPATAAYLSSIASASSGGAPDRKFLCPKDIRGAAESGTAERLAHFILSDLAGKKAKLLYLTGDKNRETLPQILTDGGVELVNLQVYGTQDSPTFGDDLNKAINDVFDKELWWVVYFAPSAAAYVTPTLRTIFDLHVLGIPHPDIVAQRPARAAAIGSTTAEFLQNDLGLRVDVVPSKPSAEALVRALLDAEMDVSASGIVL